MKACPFLMLLVLCNTFSSAQSRVTQKEAAASYAKAEKEAVDYVKALDVKTLDPTLPSQSLDSWLRSGPPRVEYLRWMLDETCDNRPSPGEEYPRCVRIEFRRGGQSGYFLVLIGTLKKGIIGTPKLYENIGVEEEGFVQTGWTDRLSGLPDLLSQPLVSTPVTNLYEKVVARHPLGLPKGADKTALSPYLSTRLTRQLEAAQACQDDFFRQYPKPGMVPKPAWMTIDLFSGEDTPAAPFFVNTNHKEPLKDGHFAVQLNAVERNGTGKNGSIIAGGIRAYAVKRDWAIIATVVPENNRFVVDDIRIFEENSTDSPSHLLTDSFIGCDGQHWVGVGSK